ncbi:hypothetical protein [Streptomyces sp. NRRL S-350]|uniref:hypothetical protein n=1 Tax=Streptomyces sp. NRRL S-350 TaxID=1463902 RepID=UPI0004BF804D|nr:hypothetical protein [Streptomyces sp. NRRL S-350]
MTRDRARKMATRAAANGSYARAARIAKDTPNILTEDAHRRMLGAFGAAGWPTASDGFPEGGQWDGYPGPLWSILTRPDQEIWDADPDDGDQVDLTIVPEFTFIAPRISLNSGEAMVHRVPATTSPTDLVTEVSAALAQAREREIAKLTDHAACTICGDHYPARHLLAPTAKDELTVCPACVFDGDLLARAHPTRLAFEIDRLIDEDLAIPAGWSAVAALLASAGGEAFAAHLNEAGAMYVPAEHWSDPSLLWIWLPPNSRPAALASLGPGASLKAVVEAVERAHPDLRERFRATLAEDLEEDPDADHEDYLVETLWPAVIAYVVTLGTQSQERPGHRPPWHVLSDSFEPGTLADHFAELGSGLDGRSLHVTFTLEVGVRTVAEALGWTTGF